MGRLNWNQFSETREGKFEANSFPDKIKNENWWARRDGRVAEGARLESVYTLTGIGGSNPSLSATQSGLQRIPAFPFPKIRE
jgi:hypothetical protein